MTENYVCQYDYTMSDYFDKFSEDVFNIEKSMIVSRWPCHKSFRRLINVLIHNDEKFENNETQTQHRGVMVSSGKKYKGA